MCRRVHIRWYKGIVEGSTVCNDSRLNFIGWWRFTVHDHGHSLVSGKLEIWKRSGGIYYPLQPDTVRTRRCLEYLARRPIRQVFTQKKWPRGIWKPYVCNLLIVGYVRKSINKLYISVWSFSSFFFDVVSLYPTTGTQQVRYELHEGILMLARANRYCEYQLYTEPYTYTYQKRQLKCCKTLLKWLYHQEDNHLLIFSIFSRDRSSNISQKYKLGNFLEYFKD